MSPIPVQVNSSIPGRLVLSTILLCLCLGLPAVADDTSDSDSLIVAGQTLAGFIRFENPVVVEEVEPNFDLFALIESQRASNLGALMAADRLSDWMDESTAKLDKELLDQILTLDSHPQNRRRLWDLRRERFHLHRAAGLRALRGLPPPKTPSIEEIQEVLEPETAIVEYRMGEVSTDIFVITSRGFRQFEIQSGKSSYFFEVDGRAHTPGYEILIEPILPALQGVKRLVIVPDPAMISWPLAALSYEQNGESRYLLEDYSLVYAPSATVLRQLRLRARPQTSSMAILGHGYSLHKLPFAHEEVAQLEKLFPGARVRDQKQVTKAGFLEELAVSNLFHFCGLATTGTLWDIDACLVFTARTELTDSILDPYELIRKPVWADTVVLNTCHTLGRHTILDEVGMGLAPALLGCGARAVIGCVGQVGDQAAQRLAVGFYSRLRLGMAKDEALRQAQLEQLRAIRAGEDLGPLGEVSWPQYALVGDWAAGTAVVETDPVLNLSQSSPSSALAAEQALRDRELGDLFTESGAQLPDSARQASLEEGLQLRRQASELNRQLRLELGKPEGERDSETLRKLEDRLARSRIAFARLAENLRSTDPGLARTLAVPPQDLDKLSDPRFLPKGVSLLQIAVRDERLLVFLTTGEDAVVKVVELPRKKLRGLIATAREGLSSPDSGVLRAKPLYQNKTLVDPVPALEELYDLLIAPLEPHLRGTRILQISTGDALRYIPFSALCRRVDGKLRFLVEDMAVSILTSSGTVELGARQREYRADRSLLVLADPDGSLPYALTEADALRGLQREGVTVFRGKEATTEALKYNVRGYRQVHLATHGVLNPEKPEASFILLAGPEGKSNLPLREVPGLALNQTELVTLSACETALGTQGNGLEIAGLAYFFEQAGASSVVASLWAVSDRSTSLLMAHFYEAMKSEGKAEALRAAQLKMLATDEFRHPFHWAPFILIGSWR